MVVILALLFNKTKMVVKRDQHVLTVFFFLLQFLANIFLFLLVGLKEMSTWFKVVVGIGAFGQLWKLCRNFNKARTVDCDPNLNRPAIVLFGKFALQIYDCSTRITQHSHTHMHTTHAHTAAPRTRTHRGLNNATEFWRWATVWMGLLAGSSLRSPC